MFFLIDLLVCIEDDIKPVVGSIGSMSLGSDMAKPFYDMEDDMTGSFHHVVFDARRVREKVVTSGAALFEGLGVGNIFVSDVFFSSDLPDKMVSK